MKPSPFQRYILRPFFYLLYHQMAWTYDLVAWSVSLGLWKSWVMTVLPYLHGPQILELGHGPGHLQAALWQHGLQPVGLDASPQMGRQAHWRLARKEGRAPKLVNGYAQSLPFANASFHQVIATFPTDYIIHPSSLSEIQRVLAPGGELIILPLAWITDRRLPYRLASGLFRVTGESPAHAEQVAGRFLEAARQAGYQAESIWLTPPSSRLLLIQAKKC